MKPLFTLLVSLFLLTAVYAQDKTVLFVGNSYMFTNDLPSVVDAIANSNGVAFNYQESTLPSYTLELHTENSTTMDLIAEGIWDYVLIQEQSQMPAFPIEQVEQNVFPFAKELADSVFAADRCAIPVFMMTWGRENGDADNCDDWPPVCDYDGMQDLLSERYIQMAEDNHSWVAPIGEAWRTVRNETDDLINLYSPDGSHPSFAGTYLAACVLYATFYDDNPVGTDYIGDLSLADAQYLQAVAAETVLETPEAWNINEVVYADIAITGFAPSFTFSVDLPPSVDSLQFDDGDNLYTWFDGSSSGLFYGEGTHYFVVDIFSPCGNVNYLDSLVIIPASVPDQSNFEYTLYPNPSTGIFNVRSEFVGQRYSVTDINGRVMLTGKLESLDHQINGTALVPGVYQLKIGESDRTGKCFVIN
jgi:hypothetical protein